MKGQTDLRIWRPLVFLLFVNFHGINSQYLNSRCNDNSQCYSNQFLQCLDGYCQCDLRSQIFDTNLNQCTILSRKNCLPNQQNGNHLQCTKNSACILSKCECQPGYSITGDFLCKPNFQNGCQGPQDCDEGNGLVCLQGSCQCRNKSLSYQGLFGCVNPNDSNFIEMMTALKKTEQMLSDNHIDLDEMIHELEPLVSNQLDSIPFNQIQSRQLFSEANLANQVNAATVDLTTSAQNQAPAQQQGGLGGLLNFFNSLGSLGNLLGGQNRQIAPAIPSTGYGQPAQNPFAAFTNILNLFNRYLPAILRFKMMINPLRIIQRLLRNFRGSQGGYPASMPQAGYGPPRAPAAAYGPPGTTQNPGGYGGPPPAAAPTSQAVQQNNFNVQPIDQPQTQASFQNFQTQSKPQQSSFENPLQFQTQQSYKFQNPPNNFENQNRQTQNTFENQNEQGFQSNSNQNYQGNNAYPQNFDNFNNHNQPSSSQNKYPRQERYSTNEDSSPYLPEHL